MEGMTPDVIIECLRRAGATVLGDEMTEPGKQITKQDLMELGLSGGSNSSILRGKLLKKLDFPEHMSANAMLQALNVLYTPEQLQRIVSEIE